MLTAFSRTAGALTLALLLAAIPAAAGARSADAIRDGQQWVLNMMNVPMACFLLADRRMPSPVRYERARGQASGELLIFCWALLRFPRAGPGGADG